MILLYKWGCDGSQQAQYKQTFQNYFDSDANIFQSSFVLLQLIYNNRNRKPIWSNPTPSSPHYCRPIRIGFVKESTDITNDEIQFIKNATNSLNDSKVKLAGIHFSVQHKMLLTMIEGKVCKVIHNEMLYLR